LVQMGEILPLTISNGVSPISLLQMGFFSHLSHIRLLLVLIEMIYLLHVYFI
jgi:hypothetical protein